MKLRSYFFQKFLPLTFLVFLFSTNATIAQKEICENTDCLPEIFSVTLNEPSKPADGNYAPQRTENFKTAYLDFLEVSNKYNQNPTWQTKYTAFQLGGVNCLRHYKLESAFAHEYLQNPDFKVFIDVRNGTSTDLKKQGFAGSRRALNLEKRMKSKCYKEVKKVYLENLPAEFNALGVDLGYFDGQGNVLKPLPMIANAPEQGSKKEQIEQLQSQVSSLAASATMAARLDALKAGFADLDATSKSLQTSNRDAENLLDVVFPKQTDLQGKMSTLGDKLTKMLSSLPRSSDLRSKIEALATQRQGLTNELQSITDESNVLSNSFEENKKALNSSTTTINQGKKSVDNLAASLPDLDNKKNELTALLNDKPKKILDALKQKVADAVQKSDDFSKKTADAEKTKKGLLDKLNDLKKAKENLLSKLSGNDKKLDNLTQEVDALSQKADDSAQDAAAANLAACEEELKEKTTQFTPISKTQTWFNKRINKIKETPQKLLDRIAVLQTAQDDLKSGKSGITLDTKTGEKLDYLLEKAKVLGEATKILKTKNNQLQTSIAVIDKKVNSVQGLLNKSDCASLKNTENDLAKIKNEQDATEPQLKDLERDTKDSEGQTDEIERDFNRAVELKMEEKELQKTYGKDIKLEPVSRKEWSESFEVKRQYWDAVFHPDDEVVQGYKGKYFQVKLKDAEKNVKLLFGPGKYFIKKSDFRNSYGSTIGSFVAEALNFTKKDNESKVVLFIQGSADIVGQKTFRGQLNNDFLYTNVTVLPQKDGSDSFGETAISKEIPTKDFKNSDLPDLRGNFLKEMISVYSKNLKPILLEGAVKKEVDKGERNAVIYLFIPEALLN